MKLLFDNNLSFRLVSRLSDVFPGAEHVAALGLDQADDGRVWEEARQQGFTLVTKDADFNEFAVMYGPPPQVVWLRIGNGSTSDVERFLRGHAKAIGAFVEDPTAGILVLEPEDLA